MGHCGVTFLPHQTETRNRDQVGAFRYEDEAVLAMLSCRTFGKAFLSHINRTAPRSASGVAYDTPSNSVLPESKKKLKRAIRERIRLLVSSYISLASFVPDEDVDVVIEGIDKERTKTIYLQVLADMEKLSEEMREFDPFE